MVGPTHGTIQPTPLLELTEAHLPDHRERLYPPTVALSVFIKQSLEADGFCQRAVNGCAAQRAAEGLSPQIVRTGAFCAGEVMLADAPYCSYWLIATLQSEKWVLRSAHLVPIAKE